LHFVSPFFLVWLWLHEAGPKEHYIYQDPDGKLVISNKQPPPGSKIIKQQNLPGVTDNEVSQAQEPGKTQPNGQTEGSPKPSKNK